MTTTSEILLAETLGLQSLGHTNCGHLAINEEDKLFVFDIYEETFVEVSKVITYLTDTEES